jgi:hypothetical protein
VRGKWVGNTGHWNLMRLGGYWKESDVFCNISMIIINILEIAGDFIFKD